MLQTVSDYFDLIDTRRRSWVKALGDAIAEGRTAFLILPGKPQSATLLERLFHIVLDDRSDKRDVLTLFEISRHLSAPNFESVRRSHSQGDVVVLIEEFHRPRQRRALNQIHLACNVVRKVGVGRDHPRDRMTFAPCRSYSAGSRDYLEVEVHLGRVDLNAVMHLSPPRFRETRDVPLLPAPPQGHVLSN